MGGSGICTVSLGPAEGLGDWDCDCRQCSGQGQRFTLTKLTGWAVEAGRPWVPRFQQASRAFLVAFDGIQVVTGSLHHGSRGSELGVESR